jgi:polyisoprenoid-binding protein YceI
MKPAVKYGLIGLVAVIIIGVGAFLLLRPDSPDAVSLDAAKESVQTTTTADSEAAGSDEDTTVASEGVEGSWTVDTETGEFDFETATGSFAGFRITEELASIGATEAVGRTGDVTGSMTIQGTTVSDATFEIDMTTITTNESRRDDKVQSALETDQFPTATFTLTEPIDLGADAADGEAVTVDAVGDLTIHGQTQQVSFPLEAQLVDGTVVVVGSLDVTFADYGVEVPTAPVVVSVEDHGPIELQLLFTRS